MSNPIFDELRASTKKLTIRATVSNYITDDNLEELIEFLASLSQEDCENISIYDLQEFLQQKYPTEDFSEFKPCEGYWITLLRELLRPNKTNTRTEHRRPFRNR